MKELSCGFILVDPKKCCILGCHPTGHGKIFDIPKGHIENGETPIQCAVRELKEETGIVIEPDDKSIIDCGVRKYTPKKDLHLFIYIMDINTRGLKCTTYVENEDSNNYGKLEMDGYSYVKDLKYFYKSLGPVVKNCLDEYLGYDFLYK